MSRIEEKYSASNLAQQVLEEVSRRAPELQRLGQEIHRDPELGCREFHTVTRLAGELEEEGFEVETGLAGLSTAFRATAGDPDSGPTIAFLTEYDAVPGLGHGGGHNLIVLAAHGAALALKSVLDQVGGRVMVIGAPAEETIGGKVVLAVKGAFDEVDAALLAHPGSESRAIVNALASWSVEVVFQGRSAHAVAAREQGINALEAMIQLFNQRDRLLTTLDSSVCMPGVILEGGVRPNLVPDRARARFSLRAGETSYLVERVLPGFRALVRQVEQQTGAQATVETIDNLYDEMICNTVLAERWSQHAGAVGDTLEPGRGSPVGSLDMGTLSYRVPALHPTFAIQEQQIATQTAAFVEACNKPRAYKAALDACRALALTGLDLMVDPQILSRVNASFLAQVADRTPRHDAPLVVEPRDS